MTKKEIGRFFYFLTKTSTTVSFLIIGLGLLLIPFSNGIDFGFRLCERILYGKTIKKTKYKSS